MNLLLNSFFAYYFRSSFDILRQICVSFRSRAKFCYVLTSYSYLLSIWLLDHTCRRAHISNCTSGCKYFIQSIKVFLLPLIIMKFSGQFHLDTSFWAGNWSGNSFRFDYALFAVVHLLFLQSGSRTCCTNDSFNFCI